MPSYTVRFLDQAGEAAHERRMECEDDDQAIERIARLRHAWALELLDGERMVWRFDSGPFMGGRSAGDQDAG